MSKLDEPVEIGEFATFILSHLIKDIQNFLDHPTRRNLYTIRKGLAYTRSLI